MRDWRKEILDQIKQLLVTFEELSHYWTLIDPDDVDKLQEMRDNLAKMFIKWEKRA